MSREGIGEERKDSIVRNAACEYLKECEFDHFPQPSDMYCIFTAWLGEQQTLLGARVAGPRRRRLGLPAAKHRRIHHQPPYLISSSLGFCASFIRSEIRSHGWIT